MEDYIQAHETEFCECSAEHRLKTTGFMEGCKKSDRRFVKELLPRIDGLRLLEKLCVCVPSSILTLRNNFICHWA